MDTQTPPAPTAPAPVPEPKKEEVAAPVPDNKAIAAALQEPAPKGEGSPPAAPEKYEIKLPEGVQADPKVLEEFTALAKAKGVSPAVAQEFVNFQAKQVLAASKEAETREAKFLETLKADPEIGGQDFEAKMEIAKKCVIRFDPSGELAKELAASGQGSNPKLIKFFYRVGKASSEDTTTHPPAGPKEEAMSQEQDLHNRYPSMYNPDGTPK